MSCQGKFQGISIVGLPFPYYFHTTLIRIPCGTVWEWYWKPVGRGSLLGLPGRIINFVGITCTYDIGTLPQSAAQLLQFAVISGPQSQVCISPTLSSMISSFTRYGWHLTTSFMRLCSEGRAQLRPVSWCISHHPPKSPTPQLRDVEPTEIMIIRKTMAPAMPKYKARYSNASCTGSESD